MSKKLIVAVILLSIIAIIPWIWIYQEFGGFTNIPHYDLMMWDFMLDYAMLIGIMFVGLLAGSQSEPPPAAQPEKQKENGIEHLPQIEESEKAEEVTEEEAPEELQDQPEEPPEVAPPEEWGERDFE